MDYLSDMALFVEVAQANGFSRAAAKLGIPQSTLSRRIAALEAALGLRLFNRSTRRLELTGAGAYYLERALPIITEARLLHGQLDDMRVSLPVDMAYQMVAPLLPEFAERHPLLRIDFDVTPRQVDLISEPFDLAVRTGKLPDSGYIATPLAAFSGCLYAAPSYLTRHGEPQSPQDLANHPCLRYGANSPGMIRQMAAAGLGIALLPEILVREDVAQSSLKAILPNWRSETTPVHALTATRLITANVRAFVGFLREKWAE
ncbi:D-malate degradation protein R [Kingella potus]|uniref:D-malate degradation protein R n=2 Tax=Kingella potus TaxID=265175 RepID=A0A377R2Y6_9NEIS|nr:LysR family transcriptional regulator [Kingella potus]STR02619.1 D-malate degradation protein R [Kingella potus]